MTVNKPESATDLWNTIAELEGIHVRCHQVRNMLTIYDEHLEREMSYVENSCRMGAHIAGRYDLLRSMMEVMQDHLSSAIAEMQDHINTLYDIDFQILHRAPATE